MIAGSLIDDVPLQVKESEVTVLEEKLKMMEDVILKSRNKRLDDLDQRMKQVRTFRPTRRTNNLTTTIFSFLLIRRKSPERIVTPSFHL